MIGSTLGKYEILEEIGKGGMAVVYRGYDTELEREVAVKVLHPHLSSQPESKRRFHREARAVARLRAPNILEIYDYSGRDSEEAYIVTEFIHGTTLRGFFEKRQKVSTEVGALIALEVCKGLRHAHENEVIHRDIKPENIMLRQDGAVKIMDFGIAQMAGTTQMTITGQILGSPAYMSPEHVENKPLDFRADIFPMGTLIYWMTTGRLPFEGRNPHAVIKRIVDGDYVEPMRALPAMGDRMAGIIRKCLEVDPDDRFQTIDELIEDLQELLRDLEVPPSAREHRKYLRAPDGYDEEHVPALIDVLLRRGREERKERNLQVALQYFNRVLSLDETNEEVLGIVESMSARNRMRRILEGGAVTLTLLTIGVGISYGIWGRGSSGPEDNGVQGDGAVSLVQVGEDGGTASTPSHEEAGVSGEPAEAVEVEAGALDEDAGALPTADAEAPAIDVDAATKRPGVERIATPHPPRVKLSGKRLVRIVPAPPAARIVIDDVDYGEYGAAHVRGIELSTGIHRVRLVPRDDFYEEFPFTLNVRPGGPDAGVLSFRKSLPLRPARVRINSSAKGATVSIPMRERSRANRAFRVRLKAREERVQMTVDAEGHRSEVLEVVLRAGQEYSLDVDLEPEQQADGVATRAAP